MRNIRVPQRILCIAAFTATWSQNFSASQTATALLEYVSARCSTHPRTLRDTIGDRASPAAAALFGTVCRGRSQFGHRHHFQFSAVDLRASFLFGLTAVEANDRYQCTDYRVTPPLLLHVLAVLGGLCTTLTYPR